MSVSLLMYLHNSLSSSWNSFLILPSILGQNFSYGIFKALFTVIIVMNKILLPCILCEKTFPERFYHHYSYSVLIIFYISVCIHIRYSSTFIFLRNYWYFIYKSYKVCYCVYGYISTVQGCKIMSPPIKIDN